MPTFAAVLAENGYENTLIGKWHLGDWTRDPEQRFHPLKHGYHHFFGMTGGGVSPLNPKFEEDGELRTFDGFCDDILTDRAVAFLDQSRQGAQDKPFLLSLHLRQPHHPWEPVPVVDSAHFEGVELDLPSCDCPDMDMQVLQEKMRGYMSAVAGVDRLVGRVMDALAANSLGDDTLVIFSADHGYNMGHNAIWHKGNGIWANRAPEGETRARYRPNLYEHSLRVPAIVRWPQRIQAGQRLAHLVSDVDWFPSILALAGCEPPAGATLRGESFAPLMLGQSDILWRDAVYSEYDMCVYERARLRGLRGQRWKLVVDFHAPWRSEFYDLKNDPGETCNLIGGGALPWERRTEIREALTETARQLLAIMRDHGDSLADVQSSWQALWANLSGA